MGLPEGGWPTRYEVIPGLDRVTEVAQRFGRFLLTQHTEPLSNYPKHPERRGAAAMIDQQLYEPTDGEAIGA